MDQVQTRQTTTQRTVQTPVQQQGAYQKKKAIFRAYQVIWYILGVIEVLLAFRILLKALAANPTSGFTSFIYALSDPFALPFAGIFGIVASRSGNIIEWSTFVAMLVYALIAYGIVKLIQLIKPTNPVEVEQGVSQ